jgi:hypothetical protein
MDPDAALAEIQRALTAGNDASARDQAHDLADWIGRGGFAPRDSRWRDILQDADPSLATYSDFYG